MAIAFEHLAPTGGFVLSVLFRAKLDGNGALNLLKSEGNSELEDSELAAGDSEVVSPELELELELYICGMFWDFVSQDQHILGGAWITGHEWHGWPLM